MKAMTSRAILLVPFAALALASTGCPGGSGGQGLPSTAPTITAVSPVAGSDLGGTSVTITGTNLAGTSVVTFGGTNAANVVAVNPTTVTADSPAHAAGVVDVILMTPVGTVMKSNAFTYAAYPTIASVSPAAGTERGGTAVTLTGTNLTNTTGITFDGAPATGVNVVDATTVTAIVPAHAVGAVDVVLTTSDGGVTSVGGYTYQAAAIGQATGGGQIACLGGGTQDLIAATADTSGSIGWASTTTTTSANSTADGEANTNAIVLTLGGLGSYAALRCDEIEIDSMGNSPCQTGNTCYTDWFLPATDQLTCLYNNRADITGLSAAVYWSSTEDTVDPTLAHAINMATGTDAAGAKAGLLRLRCVRPL